MSLISPNSNNVQICWISRTNSKFSVKKVCCVFTQFLMLEITNLYKIVLFINHDWHFDDFGQSCQIHIVFKNPKIKLFFWYEHIWHKIYIFQQPLICAWWVISKLLHVFHGRIVHIFRSAISEFSHMFSLNRWIGTRKNLHLFHGTLPGNFWNVRKSGLGNCKL